MLIYDHNGHLLSTQFGHGKADHSGHTAAVMENRIKDLRLERGLTMEQLAELANTAAPTINKLEKGERKLHIAWMRRLAKVLGVAPADLLADEDNPDRLHDEFERALLATAREMDDRTRARLLSKATLMLRGQRGLITEAEMAGDTGMPGEDWIPGARKRKRKEPTSG